MAATTTEITTPNDLSPVEQVEHLIIETLSHLGVTESAADKLDFSLAFDLGCQFAGIRVSLETTLAILRARVQAQQTQEQARAVGA